MLMEYCQPWVSENIARYHYPAKLQINASTAVVATTTTDQPVSAFLLLWCSPATTNHVILATSASDSNTKPSRETKHIRKSDWVARMRDTVGANDDSAGGMVPDGLEKTEAQPQTLTRQAQSYSAETGGSEGEPAAPEGGARMLMAAASGHMDV
eukprot:TRINITY_DN404_c0_g1_i3.p1 TRINITY_DN404_c0_g1~~TRINITY_DN404_c0_g1_i3.p1  ORF type:complete len:154 (-),score=17.58 TRINITY_DN404_c0_g1_i3:731-1192(-)